MLSVPLKLTPGHRPDCSGQAFPFSEVDITTCHAGERGISWSLQGLSHRSGKSAEGPLRISPGFELGSGSHWLLEMMGLVLASTRVHPDTEPGPGLGARNNFLSHTHGAGMPWAGRGLCGESLCQELRQSFLRVESMTVFIFS